MQKYYDLGHIRKVLYQQRFIYDLTSFVIGNIFPQNNIPFHNK